MTMMRKIAALCVTIALCMTMVSFANAATEYPPRPSGTVSDLAGVLGEKTVQDLETLNARLSDTVGSRLFVLTRHFLGGANAQQYADNVFRVWGLDSSDALLLMVIGEENYALSLGEFARQAIPADTQTSLLASHFRNAYLNRQYDEALADLSVSLGAALAKASGETLNTSGLFGTEAIQSTPQPISPSDWWYGMFAQDDYDARENDDEIYWNDWQNQWRYEETSINWRSVIIWGLVIYFLFFRKKRKRR